jgi:hypothetical protein
VCKQYSSLVYVNDGVTVLIPGYEPEKVSQCTEGKKLIIGGVEAEPKEFPHMVSYYYEVNVVEHSSMIVCKFLQSVCILFIAFVHFVWK